MPERLRPSFELLEKALSDVYEGRLPPQRASAMASLTGAMVKVINAGKADGPFSLPPQLDFPGVEEWYKTIRSYRRVKPRLAGDPPEEPTDDVERQVDEFERKFGKVKLPEEWM